MRGNGAGGQEKFCSVALAGVHPLANAMRSSVHRALAAHLSNRTGPQDFRILKSWNLATRRSSSAV